MSEFRRDFQEKREGWKGEELKRPGRVTLTLKTSAAQIRTVSVSLKEPIDTKQRRIE
jgi:hypothetical protein